jgi:hypothetical protein
MDPVQIRERRVKEQICSKWTEWNTAKRHYPNVTLSWEGHIKKQLTKLVRRDEDERRKDHRIENHLYECIYDILRSNTPTRGKTTSLKSIQSQTIRLHAIRMKMFDTSAQDKLQRERLVASGDFNYAKRQFDYKI